YIASGHSPFAQGVVDQGAMGLPDECVESAQHLLVNGTLGKDLAYPITEIIGISPRVEPEELQCGIGAAPRYAAERNIQTIQRGARHQADDHSMVLLGYRI